MRLVFRTCDVVSLANKRKDARRQLSVQYYYWLLVGGFPINDFFSQSSEPLVQIRRAACSSIVHKMLQLQLDFHSRGIPEEFVISSENTNNC